MGLLKRAGRVSFHSVGGLAAVRFLSRRGLRILCYHHFRPGPDVRASLARQCAHLRRHYRPVSLTGAAAMLGSGQPLPSSTVVLTVDDGYRDFFEAAYPVFAEYRLPVTVFLTTGFLDRRCWLWVDLVQVAFQNATVPETEVAGRPYRLACASSRAGAAAAATEAAKRMPNAVRMAWLAELPRRLGAEIPSEPSSEFAPLKWDEVRAMAAAGVDFGAHTVTHPILSTLDAAEAQQEIAESKRRIEEELGRPVAHFCFPNGKPGDFDGSTAAAVAAAGFRTAVTTCRGLNHPGDDLYVLKRITVEPDLPDRYFHECVAAFRLPRGASPWRAHAAAENTALAR